jgi:hypothetical protein
MGFSAFVSSERHEQRIGAYLEALREILESKSPAAIGD